jgi:HK97 family phage major capsid protein
MSEVTREEFDLYTGHVLERIDGLTADINTATRTPSKAKIIGTRAADGYAVDAPKPGEFITAIANARSRDADLQRIGKAALESLNIGFVADPGTNGRMFVDGAGKAMLGTTDATGGWILPNAAVDTLTKAASYDNVYRNLVTVRDGVNASAVDIPVRPFMNRVQRAVIAPYGQPKEKLDVVYNGYTATMYTLARIYDIGNQFLRLSAGAAEADVLEELATAFALGESYYMREGDGTGEPYGLVTALDLVGTYTSSFSPSATTLAGSALKAITVAVGALASRGVVSGLSAVISGTAWGTMIGQGTDTAGFFINGTSGVNVPGIAPGTIMTPWGVPVYVDPDAGDDRLIVGQFRALKLYVGDSYRVDSSNQAGDRWDNNLTGFRGEEDIAFDARPAVFAGRFQQITNLLP